MQSARSGRHGWDPVAAVRVAGLVAVVLISLRGAVARGELSGGNVATSCGVLLLAAFLWLTISGFFGYGSVRRSDWVGLVPFVVALVVRELFTLHSVQEIEIQFAQGPVGRHSIVYPLLQMFFIPIVRDPQSFTMHMNGVLGALASLGMYLFVRQRLESRAAGFLCALFLATHPVVARFSPTDGPYSLLLATWFSGLALLSAPELNARSVFGGAVLLGVAATTRIEGFVFLLASLLLLDRRLLIDAARRHRVIAVVSFLVVYALSAVHMYILFPFHHDSPSRFIPPFNWLFDDVVWPVSYNDHMFMALVWIGAAAGILSRIRLGFSAYLAMLVVLVPVAHSGQWVDALHRMVPVCAVQTIVAGIGAYVLTPWIPSTSRWRWFAVAPGVIAAFYILAPHRSDLTTPYVFNEEYDLVRSHLAPGGIPVVDCALMTFNSLVREDLDIHDFAQVVPGMKVLDCRTTDCVAELPNGECFYYVRSAACYFHADGVPPACTSVDVTAAADHLACMNATSASFERSVELQPVEVRMIDIVRTFPDPMHYPERAEVGLFRVRARAPHAAALATGNEASVPKQPAIPSGQVGGGSVPAAAIGTAADEPIIVPGQEKLLLAMLGKGATLPGECNLTAGAVDRTLVKATYTCATGQVVVELAHPSRPAATSTQTARFAITLRSGSPPAGLLGAVESLIRSQEAAFEWKFLPSKRPSPAFAPLAAGGLLGIAVLGWVLRRPKRAARGPSGTIIGRPAPPNE